MRPQGTRTFGPGSGGLVNANVLHSTRNLPGDRVVSWIHLFEPSLLGGSVGSRIEQKYLVPITANPALELLALDPGGPGSGRSAGKAGGIPLPWMKTSLVTSCACGQLWGRSG